MEIKAREVWEEGVGQGTAALTQLLKLMLQNVCAVLLSAGGASSVDIRWGGDVVSLRGDHACTQLLELLLVNWARGVCLKKLLWSDPWDTAALMQLLELLLHLRLGIRA